MTSYAPTRRGFLTAAAALAGAAVAPTSVWRAAPASAASPVHPQAHPAGLLHGLRHQRRDALGLGRPAALPHAPVAAVRAQPHPHASDRPVDLRAARHGDGLATPRGEGEALSLSFADLQRLPHHELTAVVECTGNGRSHFWTQQGQTVSGTAWTLGAVGTVRWSGVRLRDVLASVGLTPDAVSIQATGLDDPLRLGRHGLRPGPSAVPGREGARRRAPRVGNQRRGPAARPRLPAPTRAARLGRHREHQVARARSRSRRRS